jgi:hypothetical protein
LLYIFCCHELSPQASTEKFICQKFGRASWPERWPNARSVLMQDNKTQAQTYTSTHALGWIQTHDPHLEFL